MVADVAHDLAIAQDDWNADMDADYLRESEQLVQEQERIEARNVRVLRKFRRTAKPKLVAALDLLQESERCVEFEFVPAERVKGRRLTGLDYFGESVAVRHVYDDTNSCSWSDTYSGDVYLYLGQARYLRVLVVS